MHPGKVRTTITDRRVTTRNDNPTASRTVGPYHVRSLYPCARREPERKATPMKSNTTEPAQQDRLQEFLRNVDPALLASLKQDERRRRHKLITLTITGGLVMGSVIA